VIAKFVWIGLILKSKEKKEWENPIDEKEGEP